MGPSSLTPASDTKIPNVNPARRARRCVPALYCPSSFSFPTFVWSSVSDRISSSRRMRPPCRHAFMRTSSARSTNRATMYSIPNCVSAIRNGASPCVVLIAPKESPSIQMITAITRTAKEIQIRPMLFSILCLPKLRAALEQYGQALPGHRVPHRLGSLQRRHHFFPVHKHNLLVLRLLLLRIAIESHVL